MTNEAIRRSIQHARDTGRLPDGRSECFLCNTDVREGAFVVGACVPEGPEAKRFGLPVGKGRVILYLLCEECFELPDSVDRIENKLDHIFPVIQ